MTSSEKLEQLQNLPLMVEIEFARPRLTVREILALVPGATLPLEQAPDGELTIRVGGAFIGSAEAVRAAACRQFRITRIGAGKRSR